MSALPPRCGAHTAKRLPAAVSVGRGSKVFMQLSQCKGVDKELATHFIDPACNCTSKARLPQLYKQRQKRFKDAGAIHEQNQGQLRADLKRKEPCDGSSSS